MGEFAVYTSGGLFVGYIYGKSIYDSYTIEQAKRKFDLIGTPVLYLA